MISKNKNKQWITFIERAYFSLSHSHWFLRKTTSWDEKYDDEKKKRLAYACIPLKPVDHWRMKNLHSIIWILKKFTISKGSSTQRYTWGLLNFGSSIKYLRNLLKWSRSSTTKDLNSICLMFFFLSNVFIFHLFRKTIVFFSCQNMQFSER